MNVIPASLLTFIALPAAAALTAMPSSIDFGAVPLNRTGGPRLITVRNLDSTDEARLFVSAACGGDFRISDSGCRGTLPPLGSCRMQASFRPLTTGFKTCSIQVSGGPAGTARIHLSGRGESGR